MIATAVWTLATATFMTGRTDTFYGRFASPPQASLVLGSSRAAVGIVPAIVNAESLGYRPLFNFAFTMSTSPYGATYLRAIRAKLEKDGQGPGLFLVEVSPLALSQGHGRERFPERTSFLGRMHLFSLNPNVEYPFRRRERGYDIIDRGIRWLRGRSRVALHEDGWLEIGDSFTPSTIAERTKRKVEGYREAFSQHRRSSARWQSLRETVKMLSSRGRVVLLRLPVGEGIRALEHAYWPTFSDDVHGLAHAEGAQYLDLLDAPFESTDGNHLTPSSARAMSAILRDRLRPPAD